jgi:geranylgeranyl diphosphate synthase type I
MIKYSYTVADKNLTSQIQHNLEEFANQWRKDETIGTREPIDAFCDVMLRGGKRLRGILAMQSYWAHGGTSEVVAIGAARIFELLQTSLLVVDDIADRSSLRRGGPSAHMSLQTYARANNLKGDALHYGQAQAMNVAYAGLHKATVELLDLPVDAQVARRACKRLHENILVTINGQIDDIFNEATNSLVSEADVERVLGRKTPYYTILGPIELGAQLAGRETLPDYLQQYSIQAGVAFQIADDIISTFGHEDETGKGSNDDIREGKLTLLAYHALARGTSSQVIQLKEILGDSDATIEQCDAVREIFKVTGALAYAKTRLAQHERQALTALKKNRNETDSDFMAYLVKLTDYVVNRRM